MISLYINTVNLTLITQLPILIPLNNNTSKTARHAVCVCKLRDSGETLPSNEKIDHISTIAVEYYWLLHYLQHFIKI